VEQKSKSKRIIHFQPVTQGLLVPGALPLPLPSPCFAFLRKTFGHFGHLNQRLLGGLVLAVALRSRGTQRSKRRPKRPKRPCGAGAAAASGGGTSRGRAGVAGAARAPIIREKKPTWITFCSRS